MDFQIEIGKINVRATLKKIDVGWRVLIVVFLVALVALTWMLAPVFAN